MKKFLATLILFTTVFALTDCASLTEEYRFKKRFDRFYLFLDESEQKLFTQKDFAGLGKHLDERINAQEKMNEWNSIKDGEAISTFSSAQSAEFYYTILLREINRENFRVFMELLTGPEQLSFVKGEYKPSEKKKMQNFLEKTRGEYRLYGFSNEEILDFFYEISYPEISRKQFYYFCEAIYSAKAIRDFAGNRLDIVKQKIKQHSSSHPFFKREMESIRNKSALTQLDDGQLVEAFYLIGMVQMDKEASLKTLSKFINKESN